MPLDPSRSVAELRELRQLTGDDNGAQRVAWTGAWETARAWLRENLAGIGAREEIDEAGNQWFTIGEGREKALLIGGHLDSVPIACQPSQRPQSTASTITKTPTRFITFFMAGEYRSCRVSTCPWTLPAASPSFASCAS